MHGVAARGKHLLHRIGEHTLHSHLKMEGDVARLPARREVAQTRLHGPSRRRHCRVGDGRLRSRRDQRRAAPPTRTASSATSGRIPLSEDWDPEEAARSLAADTRPVHVAIQDQRNVAGFGNEYANEILFVRGILPTTPANETDAAAIVDLGARMIRANRDRVDRTFTGDARPGRTTWVYGREGRPCRRCGTLIRRGSLGADPTRERIVFWCPVCQTSDGPCGRFLSPDRRPVTRQVRDIGRSRAAPPAARMEGHRARREVIPVGTTVFERQRPAASVIRQSLADTRQSVFWLDDLDGRPSRPRLNGTVTADLAIVGGGYTGLWTALLAKRRDPGARIVVVEARTVGWAASGRNGGFCEASITHGRDNGLSRWPGEIDELDRLGMANLDGMGEDIAALRIDADWERVGTLAVATEPHQLEWLDEWAADAAAGGEHGTVRLTAAEAQASIASPTFLGAVWDKHGTALVHPGKLATGLARAAEEAGVEIFEGSPVRSSTTTVLRRRDHRHRACHGATRGAGHERLPVAAAPQPADDGPGVRLRPDDRAADGRPAR